MYYCKLVTVDQIAILVIWYDMVWYSTMHYGTLWYGTVRNGMVWYDIAGNVYYCKLALVTADQKAILVIWYGTVRYSMVHYGMVPYGMVWYGVTLQGMCITASWCW